MRPLTEEDIRSSFVNATQEQLRRLPIPGLHEMLWDEREYLGWRDPQAAQLGYIVHWSGDRPIGIVVRSAVGGLTKGIAAMCSFCHSTQPATQVRLFTAPRAGEPGRNGSTIGTYICEDLACSMLIRITPARPEMPDLLDVRSQRLFEKVSRFTAHVLETA